jgi:hypothetical protein
MGDFGDGLMPTNEVAAAFDPKDGQQAEDAAPAGDTSAVNNASLAVVRDEVQLIEKDYAQRVLVD